MIFIQAADCDCFQHIQIQRTVHSKAFFLHVDVIDTSYQQDGLIYLKRLSFYQSTAQLHRAPFDKWRKKIPLYFFFESCSFKFTSLPVGRCPMSFLIKGWSHLIEGKVSGVQDVFKGISFDRVWSEKNAYQW